MSMARSECRTCPKHSSTSSARVAEREILRLSPGRLIWTGALRLGAKAKEITVMVPPLYGQYNRGSVPPALPALHRTTARKVHYVRVHQSLLPRGQRNTRGPGRASQRRLFEADREAAGPA